MKERNTRRKAPRDRLPRAVGAYAIQERIGKGAMAVVYRAIDQRNGAEVALKVMAGDLEGDAETRERFLRESEVARQLRHPNVVAVMESGDDNGRLYIAMELLTGWTLTEFLQRQQGLDVETCFDLMIQVCQGLIAVHSAGVCHRDIKPANLFVAKDQRVKILDFGVARLAGSNITHTGCVLGTPDFMSPEQARGREVDVRSDVFSAAGVFYLMVTGRKPFAAADLPAVLHNVLRTEPLPIRADEAPDRLAALIHKGLRKPPDQRQQNAAQLASELMAAAIEYSVRTREEAFRARTVAEDVLRLAARRQDLMMSLDVPTASDPNVWQAVLERYPMLRRGPLTLGAFPLRSIVVHEAEVFLRGELEAMHPQVASLESGHADWREGETLLDARSLDAAATRFSAARRAVPASRAIARSASACAQAIEEVRERDALLESRLRLAQEVAAREDWEALLAIAAEIDQLDRGHTEAEGFRKHALRSIEAARESEARTRAQQRVQQLAFVAIAEADRASGEGRFTDALAILQALLQDHSDAPGVAEAIDQVGQAQRAAAAHADRQARERALQRAALVIEEARQIASEGRFQEAVDVLRAHMKNHPGAPGINDAIEQIQRDQHAAEQIADRRARERAQQLAMRVVDEARQMATEGRFAEALRALQGHLETHPDAPGIVGAIRQVEDEHRAAIVRTQVEAQERAQVVAVRVIEDASRLAAQGQFDEAVAALNDHLLVQPGAPGIADAIAQVERDRRVATLRAEREARERALRLAARVIEEARRIADEGRFADALAVLTSHLAQHPGATGIAAAIERVEQAQRTAVLRAEREAQERALADANRVIAEAGGMASEGKFDDAVAALRAHVGRHPDAPGIAAAIDQVELDRRAAAMRAQEQARKRAQRLAAKVIAESRQSLNEGRYDDALTLLQTHRAAHPDAPGLAEAIEEVERALRLSEVRAEQMAKATQFVGEAEELFAAGDLAAAETRAAAAVTLNAENGEARHLLERIRTAATLQREREERARRITELMVRASELAGHRNFRQALASLDQALTLDVAHVAAAELRARVAADAAADAAARKAEEVRQRRLRAAAPLVRQAEKLMKAGELMRAKWTAENALAQAPGAPEILSLLKQINEKIPPPTDDDTAVVHRPEGDDTASLAPVTPSLQEVAADLRDRASSFLRRWQVPRG